jgi:hypothetical protein
MGTAIGVVLSAIAAYSFSFAVDLLLGGLLKVYQPTAFAAVLTWSAVGMLALVVAIKIARRRRTLLALPFVVFGALALLGALVGTHPHSAGVALALLVQAAVIWRVAQPRLQREASTPTPAPPVRPP